MERICTSAALFPHPPIMIPEIGGQELQKMDATVQAVSDASTMITAQHPDTIVIISPHNYIFSDGAAIFPEPRIYGNLGDYGYPELSMEWATDMDLAEEIIHQANGVTALHRIDNHWGEKYGHTVFLDQGAFVPLYYLRQAGFGGSIVLMAPRFDNYDAMTALGGLVIKAAEKLGRRIAIIASGDLSHRLLEGSPNGYSPSGEIFDKTVMSALKRQDPSILRSMTATLIDEAGMCGLPSVYFLFGAIGGGTNAMPVYSYEGPFGVGYGVVLYQHDGERPRDERVVTDIRVQLARQSISYYLQHHHFMAVPPDLPDELQERAGAFVSLHKAGNLRGCIGTFLPIQMNIASEIIHNAVSAATKDPRFYPVSLDELDGIDISVDVLGTPESVSSPQELDPKKYGVIVMSHAQTGLLLPDLEGVDTVQQQIDIAKEKACIPPQVRPDLYRFTVTRYK
ncbi:MAG: AmmeMemoRadiSam system protein A [Megasphaera sp.]|nr:AmmeMemoRadiSam system protein A [Megasphaera sp.]MCH4187376.1 AmmeMemoRadiSam system protein A [Megasphaera sp.]MCH4217558.1 AmmeMemoRadiSam system protein A [Megasphaera sp.]